jgi:isoleucyl-tRNA synthetase
LMAPFTPFIADEIYRNLTLAGRPAVDRGAKADAARGAHPLSVHLSTWPEPRSEWAGAQLVVDMALAQRVVRLGRAAREGAALKLRQPLAEAVVGLTSVREAEALARLSAEVKEELNVKALKTVTSGSDLVDVLIHPLPMQLGRKYGKRFPLIKEALAALDPMVVAARVEASQPVPVIVDGEEIQVLPEEIEVRKSPKPGLAVAEEAGYLVAVRTDLTDELRWEGYAREISRNIQELRKKSGLEISDRIRTTVLAPAALDPVWQHHGASIAADTLSISLDTTGPAETDFTTSVKLEGQDLVIGIRKA